MGTHTQAEMTDAGYEQHHDLPAAPPGEKSDQSPEGSGLQLSLPFAVSFNPRFVGVMHCVMCLVAHSCLISAHKSDERGSAVANMPQSYGGDLVAAGIVLSTTSGILAIAEIVNNMAGTMAALATSCLLWSFVTICHNIDEFGHANSTVNAAAAFTFGALVVQIAILFLCLPAMKEGGQ